MSKITGALRRRVLERANYCCEYCRSCEKITGQALHIDHIDPAGADHLDNLCAACASCNQSKLKATSAVDPQSDIEVSLYNPRTQIWLEHFEWQAGGILIAGLTAEGRSTVSRLRMNRRRMSRARRAWVEAGLHPPKD